MADPQINVYGTNPEFPVPEIPAPAVNGVQAPGTADGPRVPVSDQTLQLPSVAAGVQAREARAQQEDTSFIEGMGAAVQLWDATRMVKRLARPRFEDDAPINQGEYLNGVSLVLNEDEREYFMDVGKGVKSAEYAIGQIEDRRRATAVVGNHPVAGLVAGFADPAWLVIPPAVRLGKVAGGAGRAVATVAGAGLAGAVTATGEGPVSDEDIALSMLMNGAAAGVVYRGGKLVPKDPEFPAAELSATVEAVKPHYKMAEDVQPGFTRFYHGGSPEGVQGPLWFTSDLRDARGWANRGEGMQVWYVDVPDGHAGVDWGDRAAGIIPSQRQQLDATLAGLRKPLMEQVQRPRPATIEAAQDFAEQQLTQQATKSKWDKFAWNMHKTMSGYGTEGSRIADLFYDNNKNLGVNSVEAIREPVLQELRTFQFDYEDMLRQQMSVEGVGLGKMLNPFTSRQAYKTQARIEKQVQQELFRRDLEATQGINVGGPAAPPHIAAMADTLDRMHKKALKEMQAAGVEGAENLLERPGYLSRKWNSRQIDNVMERLQAKGNTPRQAQAKVSGLVSLALRRANKGWDKEMSDAVGQAIVDRAIRRGYFEDNPFNAPSNVSSIAEIRDVLKNADPLVRDRVLNIIKNQDDEAGKAGMLKHRMDLDYRAQMLIDGETVSVMDLIDSKVTNIVDQYNQQVATSVAFARKGLTSRSKIEAERAALLRSIDDPKMREQAKDLFDNTVAHFRGEPAGGKVNESFRLMQQFNRMISLAWSGLWQTTEYANAAARYGMLKTLKYAMQEMPGFSALLSPDRKMAHSLNNILAEHSSQSQRMRPYLARYEDGFDMDTGSALQLSAQTAGQMVPFANAMKYVHHHQAKMVGNLIVDRLESAAKGNAKARDMLAQYGIEREVMDKLAAEFQKHGNNVDAWKDSVWMQVRPAFTKMMDESVLRGRLGDMPAFAAFDPLGKFIFTYRTFVLTAHNKLLVGGLERNGLGAVGLLMLYQFPMAMAAVQAQNVIRGDKPLSPSELASKSIAQMGGLGLFTEPFRIATGESNSIGAPGLIFADRTAKTFQGLAQGDLQKAGTAALTLFPVANANPIFNGMVNRMKE